MRSQPASHFFTGNTNRNFPASMFPLSRRHKCLPSGFSFTGLAGINRYKRFPFEKLESSQCIKIHLFKKRFLKNYLSAKRKQEPQPLVTMLANESADVSPDSQPSLAGCLGAATRVSPSPHAAGPSCATMSDDRTEPFFFVLFVFFS